MSNYDYGSDPDLQDFGEVMGILDRGPSQVVSEPLPENLWHRVYDEISAAPPEVRRPPPTHATVSIPMAEAQPNGHRPELGAPLSEQRGVVELSSRRSSKLAYSAMGIAAAIVLLVMVPLVFAWQTNRTPAIDSVAQLNQLEDFTGGHGTATLRGTSLELEVGSLPNTEDAFYEIWAIDFDGDNIEAITSLGRLSDSSEFDWPEGIDPEQYSVIDVSIEPNDGDPEHSGASVLRGELATQ